jgi:hypothetical protein
MPAILYCYMELPSGDRGKKYSGSGEKHEGIINNKLKKN